MSTQTATAVRYVQDEHGNVTDVLVPIEVWRELSPKPGESADQDEWPNEATRRMIEESAASPRENDIPFDEVLTRLGISRDELE